MAGDSIDVRVTLFGTLRGFAPDGDGGAIDLRLPPGATIAQLREAIGLPATTAITVGVNGAQADETSALRDGDRVVLFNAMSGRGANARARTCDDWGATRVAVASAARMNQELRRGMTDERTATVDGSEAMVAGLTVRALPGARFGAEIVGLDPRRIGEEQRAAIWDAYAQRHGLICFSFDRLLEADELHALTAVFGENEFAPGLINGIGKGTPKGEEHLTVEQQVAALRARGEDPYMAFIGNLTPGTLEAKPVDGTFYGEWEWHSDMSYIETPPTFSLLHGRVIPDEGGDTGFCSQVMAARELPQALRRRVQSRWAKHDSTYGSSGLMRVGMEAPASPVEAQGHAHPIIRRVPSTGRRRCSSVGGRTATSSGCRWTRASVCSMSCGRTRRRSGSATGTGGGRGRWSCGTTGC